MKIYSSTSLRSGFTLVELAAVLVIIGLLIGGVLMGRHMVRASELNSVLTDSDRYIAAVQNFQTKYNGLPGDITDATTYWGTDVNGCAGGYSATRQSATCNGDSNGKIGNWLAGSIAETFRAWQQLADAGVIEGSFTGVRGSGSAYHALPGINVPASRFNGGGFQLTYFGYYSDANYFAADYGHILFVGSVLPSFGTWNPLFTPEEAYSLDVKADDGSPASGKIMAFTSNYQSGCATTAVASTAAYSLTTSNVTCGLIIRTGF